MVGSSTVTRFDNTRKVAGEVVSKSRIPAGREEEIVLVGEGVITLLSECGGEELSRANTAALVDPASVANAVEDGG